MSHFSDKQKIYSAVYLTLLSIVFCAGVLVFNFFPRSTVSQLEKRELAHFPTFNFEKLMSGTYTKEISAWFSDSEPYRDELMQMSMGIKDGLAVALTDDNVRFHASTDSPTAEADEETEECDDQREVGEYKNEQTANEKAKIANAGIMVVGKGAKVRALMAFGGSAKGGGAYAEAANKYKEVFGGKVNVYCMVIPTAVEFYCPDNARSHTTPQRAVINNIHAHLASGVKAVDVYTPLGAHAAEDIYLRTDHHWAPLGGYYAAQQFAKVAGVPFPNLKSYDRKVVHGFVGSMYGYSKDISLKQAPEDFVYYTPRNVTYTTTYTDYTVDNNYRITSTSKPHTGPFFVHYRDGNGGAYCTFMGSDMRITRVRTSTANHRRVLILKDSFGNALPGYLFYSFEEIHVVDYRYFGRNMKEYVAENQITDILFANNIFNAYSPKIYKRYLAFLTQQNSSPRAVVPQTAPTVTKPEKKAVPHTTEEKKVTPKAEQEPLQNEQQIGGDASRVGAKVNANGESDDILF